MKPARLLRWYPRAWRERYGEELLALIQDTLDEGRPTWRLRLGVIWGGLRERVPPGGAGRDGGGQAHVHPDWLTTLVAGMILGQPALESQGIAAPGTGRGRRRRPSTRWSAPSPSPVSSCWPAGWWPLPAFIAFLREGGWPKIRRRVAWAAGATVAAGGGLAGLFLAERSMSSAQVNHSWAYGIGVVATTAALVVASGLWASAVTATAKHLKLATRARAAQPLLAAVTLTAALAIVPANLIWLAAIQSSLPWLVVGVTNLALVGFVTPRSDRAGRAPEPTAAGRRQREDDRQPVRSADTRPPPGLTIWGAAWQAAQSALIAPAVCSSSGRYSPLCLHRYGAT